MTTRTLKNKVSALIALQEQLDAMSAQADALKEAIKNEMGEREELQVGDYLLTYKVVKSSRVDTKALKEDMPEVAKKYTIANEYRRFAVK